MNLPKNYTEVKVKENLSGKISAGIINLNNKIHCLFLFTERDGVLIYTSNETKECFTLINPYDGSGCDINKLLK